MIDLWENKNIEEKNNLWMSNNTGILMDEPVLRIFRLANPNRSLILPDESQKIPGGSIVRPVGRIFIDKRRVLFAPGNVAVEQRRVDMPLAPA